LHFTSGWFLQNLRRYERKRICYLPLRQRLRPSGESSTQSSTQRSNHGSNLYPRNLRTLLPNRHILLRGYQRDTPEPHQWQLRSRTPPNLFLLLLLPLLMEAEKSTSEILNKSFQELQFVCGDTLYREQSLSIITHISVL
jgi:hypothetical protein